MSEDQRGSRQTTAWRRLLRIGTFVLLAAGVSHYLPGQPWYITLPIFFVVCVLAELGFTGRIEV